MTEVKKPKIDPSKIRVGDEVDVRRRVLDVLPHKDGSVSFGTGHWITPSDIIAHHPRQLHVGDKVIDSTGEAWEIAGPRRESADSGPEYALFNGAQGYGYEDAGTVESWERVQ